MRIPFTKYGLPQVVIFPAVLIFAMLGCFAIGRFFPNWLLILIEFILAAVLIWALSFFRDPKRVAASAPNLLLAPADGKIADIEIIEENDFICGRALRIGIFLSVFNVHINRAPCNVKVEKITYKPGKYKNAMSPAAGKVNESNALALIRTDAPQDKLIVRQISGAIARRIVCGCKEGDNLAGGQKFGMIKFGSRTELYVPFGENVKRLVKIGDKVKAGLTPLVKYEI